MNLEFELKPLNPQKSEGFMTYDVMRKGLPVGILILEKQYEKKIKKLMTLHNKIIKNEDRI